MTGTGRTTPSAIDDMRAARRKIKELEQRVSRIEHWTWIALKLKTSVGWNHYEVLHGGSWAHASYAIDNMGIVHLRGLIANSIDTTETGDILTSTGQLPVEARPLYRKIFPVATGNYGAARLDVLPDGSMQVAGYPPYTTYATYLSLEGITWVAGG